LLLQSRIKTRNRELGTVFKRWNPTWKSRSYLMRHNPQHLHALEKKRTNSGPFMESTDKHRIYTPKSEVKSCYGEALVGGLA
jgi:hypothetical protein